MKSKLIVAIDQIAPSTGGFWTTLDIVEALQERYDVKIFIIGFNYYSSIKTLITIVKERFGSLGVLYFPFVKKNDPSSNFLKSFLKTLYSFFLYIVFFKDLKRSQEFLKTTQKIFLSSFISLRDLEELKQITIKDICIIQNHAGSIETIGNFSKIINGARDNSSYSAYLAEIDKILFQSQLQEENFRKIHNELEVETFSFLPSINERKLKIKKAVKKSQIFKDVKCFNIVYVATIQKRKRQDFCLKVFKELYLKDQKINLFLIGEYFNDDYFSNLKEYIEENKISHRVHFLGYREDYVDYLRYCDLVIHPSGAEGVSRILRESLFFGKAIIASNIEGNRDLFENENSAVLIDPENIKSFSESVLMLKNDINLLNDYEKKARISYDKHLSFDMYKKNILNYF